MFPMGMGMSDTFMMQPKPFDGALVPCDIVSVGAIGSVGALVTGVVEAVVAVDVGVVATGVETA